MGIRRIWPTGWRAIVLLLVGSVMGANLIAPAVAHVAGWSHNWSAHIKPRTDARYYTKTQANARFLPGGTAPAGVTVRGTFWMGVNGDAGFDLATSEISFGYKFASAPTPHFIQSGDTPPAECPGSSTDPQAMPGHLCVYESLALNAGLRNVNGPGGDGTTYAWGARLFIRSAAAGDFYSGGTWAAKSPTPTAAPEKTKSTGTNAGV